MPSIGEALQKISELESRKAILVTLRNYLHTNYCSFESGPAEMHIGRADLGRVPEEHIVLQMENFELEIKQIQSELDEWRGLSVLPPVDDGDDEEDAIIAEVRKQKKRNESHKRQPT